MKQECDGLRLRIFTHEAVHYYGKSMHMALVERARAEGIADATVFRGIEGYGVHRHIHTSRLVDASGELPVVVELIDREAPIRRFLPLLDEMLPHGTVTIAPVHIITYGGGAER